MTVCDRERFPPFSPSGAALPAMGILRQTAAGVRLLTPCPWRGGSAPHPAQGMLRGGAGSCGLAAGMRPHFSLSCQRKAAAPGGKETAFVPQIRHPQDASLRVAGVVGQKFRQRLIAFCRVRCTQLRAAVLPRIWWLGRSLGAVDVHPLLLFYCLGLRASQHFRHQ